MARKNTSRTGMLSLSVLLLLLAFAAAGMAGEGGAGQPTPGFERIEMPDSRGRDRPAGNGFTRLGPAPAARPLPSAARMSTRRPVPAIPAAPPKALTRDAPPQEPWRQEVLAPPTPEGVENYRRRLEARLLEKYNNTPEYAGKVARVTVVLSKPLETSVDGTMIRADFDQLVVDAWGKRIPALEKEYFVVTFGSGGVRQVRSDPSIRVGLELEKTYSERSPLAGDPFRGATAADTESFAPADPAAQGRMAGWWRPEYPEP